MSDYNLSREIFCMDPPEQQMKEKNKKLTEENKELKNKLNSVLTDKITILTPIAAVDCPRTEQLEEVTECQKCQYHHGAIIGEQADKNLYGRVFCAFRNIEHVGMW